ncbi:sugar diacid recognition domain-containing protein [Virgibacillus ainsalahensis]
MILNQIAQKVSNDTSAIIGYPVSISDEYGYLIGVSDSSRIGMFDELLAIVIRENRMIYWGEDAAAKLPNIYPGVAAPISLNGEVVGAIGILDRVEENQETTNYIKLVKNHIEMMCHEEIRKEIRSFEASSIDSLIQYILHFNESNHDRNHIVRYGDMLGYDLRTDRACIVIEVIPVLPNQDNIIHKQAMLNQLKTELRILIEDFFRNSKEDLIGTLNNEQHCILMPYSKGHLEETFINKIKEITRRFNQTLEKRYKLSAIVAIGDFHQGISGMIKAYHEAIKLINAGKKINQDGVLTFNNMDIMLGILLEEIHEDYYNRINDKIQFLINDENFLTLSKTFLVYCQCRMNISEASRKLYIHRNSLIYRLEKIKKLTNLDINDFENCLIMYISINKLLIQLSQTEIGGKS